MTTFDAYLGRHAAHGRRDLYFELKQAMRQVPDHGGFSTLTQALNIPRAAIEQCGGLGIMRIRTQYFEPLAARYFEPLAIDGVGGATDTTAVVIPVWEPDLGGDLVDLLAMRLDHPAQFSVRTGYAKCLGTAFADDARDRTTLWSLPGEVHPSLQLFPNPLIWLRGNCAGTVLLHRAWITYVLTGIKSVTAFNLRHAQALHELMIWPEAPTIFLQRQRKAAAA